MGDNNALVACAKYLEDILDAPLESKSRKVIFSKDTIADVRKIAEASIYSRKKKNYGVIVGSLTSVAGGITSVVGGALIPFTFGTSISLIVCGGVVALVGAGTSIGSTIEKIIGDKSRVENFKPHLELFVHFNKCFAESTVTIHELLVFLREKMSQDFFPEALTFKEEKKLKEIGEKVKKLHIDVEREYDIFKKVKVIDACVKEVHFHIGELVKHLLPMNDLREFPETAAEKEAKDQNEKELSAFDRIAEAIPSPPEDENAMTFRVLIRRYLDADLPTARNQVGQVKAVVGEAAGKVLVGGAAVGGRAAIRALDASDNVIQIGGTVARIAKGISAAAIVLSAFGIVVDLAFLGHGVYDLLKLNSNERKRAKGVKIESKEFADQLRDLAEIMESINDFCKGSSSNNN